MRGLLLFVAGLVAGILIMQPGQAQPDRIPGIRLNHVGVFAKNFDESYNFYTKTMGFREAFSLKDKDGKPTVTYLQINRDTFLELAPATGDRTPGVSHVGILADDLNGTVVMLRQRDVKVDDPRTGATKAPLTSVIDPNGIRLELLDFAPDSLQRKAIESWR
jgi:catechol 2,3-dioxygenase-like lactoylglutathione lyase family enzyme